MELLSRIIITLWKADLWFCEFCKCEISRVRGDYPFTALAGATIRIIRCWIKEFLCEHHYDNIIQYASYCIFNYITWSFWPVLEILCKSQCTPSFVKHRSFQFDPSFCDYKMVLVGSKILTCDRLQCADLYSLRLSNGQF